jgi:hypothetical protein
LQVSEYKATNTNAFFSRLDSPIGTKPFHHRCFKITDTPQSVWLLWTCDRPVAATSKLTPHNTPNRRTSMPPAKFEPAIPARNLPSTHAVDSAATGIGAHTMLTLCIKQATKLLRCRGDFSGKRLFMFPWQCQNKTPKHVRKPNGLLICGDIVEENIWA